MKIICAPLDAEFGGSSPNDLEVILYSHADRSSRGEAGATILDQVKRAKLRPAPRAWDLLSLALSVVSADTGANRADSADGWTREIELNVAVSDPAFFTSQKIIIEELLRFLTTDLWSVSFAPGGVLPAPPTKPTMPDEDCVALLSGGLDSLVGAIDLVAAGRRPYLVSQVAQGDKAKQSYFAAQLGGGLSHLQLNHDANCPGANERSQRSRSIIFFAYAVLLGTSLRRYHDGDDVTLYVCENGFISINPPLTAGRVGALSTRTTHPVYLSLLQQLLTAAGLRVQLENPYQLRTKGEMLVGCTDQVALQKHASNTTSCGRFARHGYRHCGRCVPCLIRRAAFHAAGMEDGTPTYAYDKLSKADSEHAGFDDVRSAAMAIAEINAYGFDRWLGAALSFPNLGDTSPYKSVVQRGIKELENFLKAMGVK